MLCLDNCIHEYFISGMIKAGVLGCHGADRCSGARVLHDSSWSFPVQGPAWRYGGQLACSHSEACWGLLVSVWQKIRREESSIIHRKVQIFVMSVTLLLLLKFLCSSCVYINYRSFVLSQVQYLLSFIYIVLTFDI